MLNEQEINLIIKDLNDLYRYDFHSYSKDSFQRRVNKLYAFEKFSSFSELRSKLRDNKGYADEFIDRITVNVTSMFRDEHFFTFLRNKLIPQLSSLPTIKVWHAGCSSGEEGFSLAILLHEAGLLHKSQITASDVNPRVIKKAQLGIFSESQIQGYEKNYKLSGGQENFNEYHSACSGGRQMQEHLRKHIHFITHSLTNGSSLGHFDLILCRNVLIYFDLSLQNRVFDLFDASLSKHSFLALGEKETLKLSALSAKYEQVESEKIWKKVF